MIIIEKIEVAINIINLKIAKEMKENKQRSYKKLKEKIVNLENERDEIYKGNEEIIDKVLTKYMKEVEE